jgi:hypothetical protein
LREAIVKQNPDNENLFAVFFYYRLDTPSGCERWVCFASTNDITKPEAIKIADDFNNRERLLERQSG